jgi:hypothetical protein
VSWVSDSWAAVNARCAASASTGGCATAGAATAGAATVAGDGAAVGDAAGVVVGACCAGVAAAVGSRFVDGSPVFCAAVPDMPAAYAVMCVRTSISFARVAASSAIALGALPVVPAAPGVALVAVDVSLPSISVMILSIAETSVAQFGLTSPWCRQPVSRWGSTKMPPSRVWRDAFSIARAGCGLRGDRPQ